ncbi:solute carrier family 22 member 11 [Bubalus kerabau]|uniref:solute carrier family 22 member 11 n=1 Tax=Bubalus carabanensis TaxID=3119969 RepID=UPI00244E7810|nr:solute carrier family 22 member 11 [Bubalus carabanensis]
MVFTELLEQAVGVGLFQALQILTFFFFSVWVPFQLVVENSSAAVPGHCCWAYLLDNGSGAPANLSPEALLPVSIPPGPNRGPHQCLRFHHPQWQLLDPNATATNWSEADTELCVDGWIYDHSTFTSTIVTEWDLVCEHQGLKPLGQSIYMAGAMVRCIVCGFLSHRFGRKRVLSWFCLLVAVTSISTVAAPSFPVYCGLQFLSTLGLSSILLTSTMLMVEWTMTSTRAVTMAILGSTYSISQMAMGGLAFALQDWRTLQLAMSVPFFITFLISWWLPESARWRIIVGKPDQALQELKKVAKINGHKEAQKTLTIEVLMSSMQEEVASAKSRQSVLDLFRLPVLHWRTCNLLVVNFFLTVSYYGIVLDLQNLGSNIFLFQVLFGAVDLLARAITTFLLRFFGHRTALADSLAGASLAILANTLVLQDLQTLRVVFAVLGKGCFGLSLTCIMIYKPELFPISLRIIAEGFLYSAAWLGSVMGPLIRMTCQVLPLLPPLSCGVIPIAAGLIVFLPETRGLPLPDTIQDLERQRSAAARGGQQEVVITESTWF